MNDSAIACRSCGYTKLEPILSFGKTPLADALLTKEQLDQPEIIESLDLVFCPQCSLVQITKTVPPEILFCRDYPYFSSVSKSLLNHFGDSAKALIESRQLNSESLVVEAASNDGYMLKNWLFRTCYAKLHQNTPKILAKQGFWALFRVNLDCGGIKSRYN
ncbi:MAG: hypothetical protein RIG27_24795 [Coleofasciculus sp. F4-SAH-05]